MIVDPDFCDHWKTRMLVGLLGNDEAAPVYVLRLWAHCQNRRKSTFDNLPTEALKALCRFPGHSNKLETSLAASGFVRREGETLTVLGWSEYNASLIAAWSNGAQGGRPPKKPPGSGGSKEEKPTGKPTGSREEKRREEKNTHTHTADDPDEFRKPGWAMDAWQGFEARWNTTERADPWRCLTPPDIWLGLVATPGWLERAYEALEILPSRKFFETPLPLTRFFEYIERIRSREFANPKEQPRQRLATAGAQPRRGKL